MTRFTFFAFTLLLLFESCQLFEGQPDTSLNTENVKTVRGMFEAFNRHEWTNMAGYYRDPARFLDPFYGQEYVEKSRPELVDKYSRMEKLFPDIHDEVIAIYPSGNTVVVEFISHGTGPDSVSWKLPICSILTLEDGLIVQDATYYDQATN